MNFCVDCKYCKKYSWEYDFDYYCRKPCLTKYDYITGNKITNTFTECVSVRQNNPTCEYFEQKPNNWCKKLIKKFKTLIK